MIKYWVKNRLIFDFSISVILSLLFSFAFVFSSNNNYQKIQNENSIYLNSNIDYQIPNPSINQLNEIKTKSFVDDVFGYYLTKTTAKGSKSSKVNFLMSDMLDSLSITMFNDETEISSIANNDRFAYIDKICANKLDLNCGDDLAITIANNTIKYTVCAIYDNNTLFAEGTVIVDFSGEVKSIYESNTSSRGYSGAFIDASDEMECESFLKNYIPEGRLKERSEFDSDESYEAYNDAIKSGKYFNEITNFWYIRRQAKSEMEAANMTRTLMSFVGSVVVGIIFIISSFVLRYRKSENNYFKDILKNKTTIIKYRTASFLLSILVFDAISIGINIYFKAFSFVWIPIILVNIFILLTYVINFMQDKSYTKIKVRSSR